MSSSLLWPHALPIRGTHTRRVVHRRARVFGRLRHVVPLLAPDPPFIPRLIPSRPPGAPRVPRTVCLCDTTHAPHGIDRGVRLFDPHTHRPWRTPLDRVDLAPLVCAIIRGCPRGL